jgi:hypothetical protein
MTPSGEGESPAKPSFAQGGFTCTERLAEAGIDPSVGADGDSYDNALAETVIGLFKTEAIDAFAPWRTCRDVEWETLKWIDWYSNRRLLAPIGDIPPAEAENAYFEALDTLDQAAWPSKQSPSGKPASVQPAAPSWPASNAPSHA